MHKGKSIAVFALAAAAVITSAGAAAADRVTAKEAEAMVKKGVAYINANPRDKAMADITTKTGAFVDRELYLTVYTLDGTALAHGANEKFVGKNMIDLRDGNGKEHIRERMELAKTKPAFWHEIDVLRTQRPAGRLRRHLQTGVTRHAPAARRQRRRTGRARGRLHEGGNS
jgi:cytochrome c